MKTGMILALATLTLASGARAEIRYKVQALPETKQLAVEVTIPTKGAETVVQAPRWMPGFYMQIDYGARLKDFTASAPDGQAIPVEAVDANTWKIPSGTNKQVTLRYKAPLEWDEGMGHFSGIATYVYVVGRTQEKCRLLLDLPKDSKVAVGLDGKGPEYKADTYDTLADNPVTFGSYLEETYTVAGKEHVIAVRGAGAKQINLGLLREECEFVAKAETDFMGGAPYGKYVWHFNVRIGGRGGGGLEHLSSTEISLGSDLTRGMAELLAHEFFHLWNVKRIRSQVLGPFDYTQLPKTGALWWLEGTTDYYSQALLARYGWSSEAEWWGDIARNIANVRRSPARLTTSAYDVSARVGEANNGRGNSNGFGMSYYDYGYVLGLCFDLELLAATKGKRSLDDVEWALWRKCRNNQPGFAEDEIRKQLIAAGGESFGPLYDKLVRTPNDPDVEGALSKVGLELANGAMRSVANPTPEQLRLRELWRAKRR